MVQKDKFAAISPRRGYAIILMLIGSTTISLAGLAIRNIEMADNWQINLYRSLAFGLAVSIVLLFRYGKTVPLKIRGIGFKEENKIINADFNDKNVFTYIDKKITYRKNLGYNSFNSNEDKEFIEFIEKLVVEIKNNSLVKLHIVGSSSKVPTRLYSSNKLLAEKRVSEAKKLIYDALKIRNIDSSSIKIVREDAIVSGPEYNLDRSDKSKYLKYQYFSITVK